MQRTIHKGVTSIRYVLLGQSTGGFSHRLGDKMVVDTNLEQLGQMFGNNSSTLIVAQGGSAVTIADASSDEAECDALITTTAGHNLLLRPADCPPLLLFSMSKPILALVHCARTSLDQGVIEKTVQHLKSLGVMPEDCAAYIGPGIDAKTYVLPATIMNELTHPLWSKHVKVRDGDVAINLVGFINARLLQLGLSPKNISRSHIATDKGNAYYSHYGATRHNKVNGRNGFVCSIKREEFSDT